MALHKPICCAPLARELASTQVAVDCLCSHISHERGMNDSAKTRTELLNERKIGWYSADGDMLICHSFLLIVCPILIIIVQQRGKLRKVLQCHIIHSRNCFPRLGIY